MESKQHSLFRWPLDIPQPPWWRTQTCAYIATLWMNQHAWWLRFAITPLSELTARVIRFRRRAWAAKYLAAYRGYNPEEEI